MSLSASNSASSKSGNAESGAGTVIFGSITGNASNADSGAIGGVNTGTGKTSFLPWILLGLALVAGAYLLRKFKVL
jgi:hypothetical protein